MGEERNLAVFPSRGGPEKGQVRPRGGDGEAAMPGGCAGVVGVVGWAARRERGGNVAGEDR